MRYYKYVENGIIAYIGEANRIPENGVEITQEEKEQLKAVIAAKPEDTLEAVYRLKESGQYEAFNRTHEETVQWYVDNVRGNEMALSDVPEDYYMEVETQLQPEAYGWKEADND